MRRLVAVLLALCLMCGVCVMAEAEEIPTLTYETEHYAYDLPANWSLMKEDTWDDGPIAFSHTVWDVSEPIIYWVDEASGYGFEYFLGYPDIYINHMDGEWLSWDSGLSSLKEYDQHMGSPFSHYGIPLHEKSMSGGIKMAYGSANGRVAYLWCNGSLTASFTAVHDNQWDAEGISDAQIEDDLYNRIILPFFQSIRPVGTEKAASPAAAPIQDVAVEGKQVFRIGDATFQVEPDLVVENQSEMAIRAANARYEMVLEYIDWVGNDIDINVTGDNQYDHLVFYWLLNGSNVQEAMSIAGLASDMACDMPDGDIVKLIINEAGVMFTHYFDGKGVVMLLMPKDSEAADELIMIGVEVMKSFRVDGITEEDMRATAEAAAAARAEAEAQAAVEAAAQKYVVITADSGKIRTEASISGGLIKTAYKGESFVLIKEITDWFVVDVNGRTGYIHKGVAAIQ